MRLLASLIFIFGINQAKAYEVEPLIASNRLTVLKCTSWNPLGFNTMTLKGDVVESITNGVIKESYKVLAIGNASTFSYINLKRMGAKGHISLVFAGQTVGIGAQGLAGGIHLNLTASPMIELTGVGVPWAATACSTDISE